MIRKRFAWSIFLVVLLMLVASCEAPVEVERELELRTLTEQEMIDMMVGSSIQATRASNSARMIERVKTAFAEGKTFTMIDIDDMPDDWTVVVPAAVGGGGAWEHVRERAERQNLPTIDDRTVRAIKALSKHLDTEFDAIVRIEAAGGTISAFMAAAELGVPVVDACISDRARPEMSMQIPFINDIPAAPTAVVTRWGDTLIIDKAADDYRVEDLARAMAVASGGVVSMAHNAMTTEEVRRGVIPGSVSDAILYGKTVREAVERGEDPIEALLQVTNGYKLFQGVVSKADYTGDRGFSWWDVELEGVNEFDGHLYKVFVKNENIVSWLDGEPDAMSPDFISNLDPATGDAITGAGLGGYPIGMEVVMVGWRASPMWRVEKGIEVFGPRYFGFDFDYVPLEELQEQRGQRESD